MQQIYEEPKQAINNVMASSAMWHENNIVVAGMWNVRGENSIFVARTL